MQPLAPDALLALWERGARRHPLDRGLVLLAEVRPEDSMESLADVSIGERDQALLTLHGALFGDRLAAFVDCPACGTRLEFSLDADALCETPTPPSIEMSGLRIRPPSSRDVAAALREPDDDARMQLLARRCVLDADAHDGHAHIDVETVQRALATIDTAADVELAFACVSCAHTWHVAFDVVGYLWQEIDVRARRLLHDVDALARAYGWTERDVLALSDERRRTYVEMVTS